jgi:hypothetical protein
MSGAIRFVGVDFSQDLSRSIVFVAHRFDSFWCETGAVTAAWTERAPRVALEMGIAVDLRAHEPSV